MPLLCALAQLSPSGESQLSPSIEMKSQAYIPMAITSGRDIEDG